MVYASLFTATRPSKSETDPKRFQYANTVLVPAGADISALEDEIDRIFKENVPEAKRATTKWKRPILLTADQGTLAGYADDYPITLRANSKAFQKDGKPRPAPDVIDNAGNPVDKADEPQQTYNGRWCRMSLNPYWYPANDGQPGVSLGLVNVQLLYHDDPLAGGKVKASSDFEAIADADMADLDKEFA
ncbi:DUF2815 family protein [Mesorhizobium sp. M0139]